MGALNWFKYMSRVCDPLKLYDQFSEQTTGCLGGFYEILQGTPDPRCSERWTDPLKFYQGQSLYICIHLYSLSLAYT